VAEINKIPGRFFLQTGILIFFLACAGNRPVSALHPDFYQRRPNLIAVLPMDNMSVDLDATPLVRPIVYQRLIYQGYRCLPLDQLDQKLKDNGAMISHDVYMFTPRELGNLLGVDALVYGTVTEFNKHYAFLYSDIIVGLSLEMVDARTGETLWKSEETSTQNTLLDSLFLAARFRQPEQSLAAVLAYNAAFALLSQYRPYAEEAVRGALESLPPGPFGMMFYPWDRDHTVWEDDYVDRWLRFNPLIPAYSPKTHQEPEENDPETNPPETDHHPKSGGKGKPDLQILKPGPKPGTGIIINLNPSTPPEESKSKGEKKFADQSDSKNSGAGAKEEGKTKSESGKTGGGKEKSDSDQADSGKKDQDQAGSDQTDSGKKDSSKDQSDSDDSDSGK